MTSFLTNPKTIFIEITTECNFKCKYCHMWLTKEKKEHLSTSEKMNLVRDFQTLNPDGEVVLTGGETMLKYDEFFALCNKCLELNLVCSANTNASFINHNNIERLLREGPKYLVISLDSNIERIHDYSRGITGSYNHILSVIEQLVALKKEIGSATEVITNSVLYDDNIYLIEDFISFIEDIGVDGSLFQVLSRTFHKATERDYFFEKHFFKNKLSAIAQIQKVIDSLGTHPIVRTSKQDFEWMKLYIENPDFIAEQVCDSHERNLMIDTCGELQLCFNMRKLNNGNSLGNIRDFGNSLLEGWLSQEAINMRSVMKNCRLNCGMLNCHRRK